jgi:hypothetical protein
MSNTSNVSPYDANPSPAPIESAGRSLVQWLSETTAADQAVLARLEEDRRSERLRQVPSHCLPSVPTSLLGVASVGLHLRTPESLVQSAQKLGYRLVPFSSPTPLKHQPVLLERPSGERLAILTNSAGRLVIHTSCAPKVVQGLMRQHSLDRALDHLTRKGMQVKTATLANGEIQILALEPQAGQRGGAAELKAQIHLDGRAWIDIEEVRGNQCEKIVEGLAKAMGAQVANSHKKDNYYQTVGECAKVKDKV